tara:strand:+ start:71 stop:334 length:264 start_codon:yes stop_codon:yes gene_type:complete
MNHYIEACCELPPLDKPSYCEESDQWNLWFAETGEENCPWAYSVIKEQDLICVGFDTQVEAQETFNKCMKDYYNQTEGEKTNEENDS